MRTPVRYRRGMGWVDDPRGARARELRSSGLSRRQIADQLGIRSQKQLTAWLRGTTAPGWTRRPNAKDDVKEQARKLRADGRSIADIATTLGVSKSSVSLWVRDVLLTDDQRANLSTTAVSSRAASNVARRIALTERVRRDAMAEIGGLSDRELFLVGVTAYWAEGAKAKPWRTGERVAFINSDPTMVSVFLAFLALVGISPDDCTFRVSIHESADVEEATAYWADVVGVPAAAFGRPTLKRHVAKTVRKNTGDDYRGCLLVYVRRSTNLNRRIAGWWAGIAAGCGRYASSNPVGDGVTAARLALAESGGGSNPPPRAALPSARSGGPPRRPSATGAVELGP